MIFGDKLYLESLKKLIAFDKKGLIEAFDFIDSHRNHGYFVGYIKYEAKDIFLDKEVVSCKPLLYFEHFNTRVDLDIKNNIWEVFYPHLIAQIDYKDYEQKISFIKEAICRGDSYQINFTYPFKFHTHCEPMDIFKAVLKNQDTPYKALISNEYESILSFSPELFFEINSKGSHSSITTRPMKGTIKRGDNAQEDKANKEFLKNDIKNRSENVMIVDLLRNDLSKIALKGSVCVNKLFEIQTHPTLHQMISEVSAEIPKDIGLYKIFESLFPCGSITGAPKIKTMEIIENLEGYERNVYCGGIGVIEADKMCFSVPIRTFYKSARDKTYSLGVGGGIVWDSKIEDEWSESKLKSLFIYPKIDFCLVETMKIQGLEIFDYSLHLRRLKASAEYFGFGFDESLETFKPEKNGIIRILLDKNGNTQKTYMPMLPICSYRVILHNKALDNRNDFLYHKSTYRPWYEDSMCKIKEGIIFDEIFFNQNEELTEGARSNLVLEINGELFTPPIECGLLGGIYREDLLRKGFCKEKVLSINDLQKAQKIYCINSVRGMVEVELWQ